MSVAIFVFVCDERNWVMLSCAEEYNYIEPQRFNNDVFSLCLYALFFPRCTTITNFTLEKHNTFTCDGGPMLGQYVTIYSENKPFMILCEVWIYGTNKGTLNVLIHKACCSFLAVNVSTAGQNQQHCYSTCSMATDV